MRLARFSGVSSFRSIVSATVRLFREETSALEFESSAFALSGSASCHLELSPGLQSFAARSEHSRTVDFFPLRISIDLTGVSLSAKSFFDCSSSDSTLGLCLNSAQY